MKEKANRGILFAKVNEKKENLLSLIFTTDHVLALSDEQIRTIDQKLLVRSLVEFEEKFDVDFSMLDFVVQEENKPIEAVEEFYHTLIQMEEAKKYKVWYYQDKEQQSFDQQLIQVPVKLYEIWLGVKSFFEQGRGQELELLVTNLAYEEWEQKQAAQKLSLYIETVNGKEENNQQIAYAIFPEMPIASEQSNHIRERFEGKRLENENSSFAYESLARVFGILESAHIIACFQYETSEKTSAKILAKEGREKLQKEASFLQEKVHCESISCCYPNLTWIEDKVYIGAAYVVAGMLLAGMGERSTTTMPRELYPYEAGIEEEIKATPFGAMLAYSDQAGEAYMLLYSARSQRWSNGTYHIICRE